MCVMYTYLVRSILKKFLFDCFCFVGTLLMSVLVRCKCHLIMSMQWLYIYSLAPGQYLSLLTLVGADVEECFPDGVLCFVLLLTEYMGRTFV